MDDYSRYSSAVQDFKRSRARAALQEALGLLGGKRERLLSFEQVRKLVGGPALLPRGLQEIPLDSIVGSVGRYEDFNRQFLPRQESQAGRWARVRMAMDETGLPPIEVYKIGEVYFVSDGHHRVSVAREVGAKRIEAYVTEIPSKVKLSPDDDPEDVITKAEYVEFLKKTGLDQTDLDVDLQVTTTGRYEELLDHIAVHRYFMGQERGNEVPYTEALHHWIQEVYMPAVRTIRQLGLLRDFPGRTEADIYLWLMKHRSELVNRLGWELSIQETASHLWNRLYTKPRRSWERFRRWLARIIPLKALDIGPKPTLWRLERAEPGTGERLFPRILVPISGEDASWRALETAVLVAQREDGSELRGVHVLREGEHEQSELVQGIRREFDRRLAAAGLSGRLVIERGNISRRVEARSHWSDLVVLHLKHPPGVQPMQRLLSGLRAFLQRSPRPALVVPAATKMEHGLLAYDGSRKANEALYLASYLAHAWGTKITVLTSWEKSLKESIVQQKAKSYLIAHEVEADYIQRRGRAGKAVVAAAAEHSCDLVLMGGYGQGPIIEVVMGSTLDLVLREFPGPVWICN